MNARTVSLPDLASEKRRSTALSLSEGFCGATRDATLSSSQFNFPRRPTGRLEDAYTGDDGASGSKINQVLPIYYRTRQIVLQMTKAGQRIPVKLQTELKQQEKAVGDELRPLHPLLFQRLDNVQMDRLLRVMPILKCSEGRWLFGAEELAEAWPDSDGDRAFLLLYGRVSLFQDSAGAGRKQEVTRGAIFGEQGFRLYDEGLLDHVAGAAYCEEATIVGCLSGKILETAFADRAFGNKRIAQLTQKMPTFARVLNVAKASDGTKLVRRDSSTTMMKQEEVLEADKSSNAINTALRDLSKIAAPLHIRPGGEVLMAESLDETVLIVVKGGIEVRADVTLTERLEYLPPKKARVRVILDRADKLLGDSWLDKLDPYVIVKLGEYKRFQTPHVPNMGSSPKFEYTGVLQYSGEETLEFTVMDHDKFSADELLGNGSLSLTNLPDGWSGKVDLTRPKGVGETRDDEPAGRVFVTIKWDCEKVSSLTRTPKQISHQDQTLFKLGVHELWGHEQLMLGDQFRRILENSSLNLTYALSIGNFRIYAEQMRGSQENIVLWKVNKDRFEHFMKHCGREKAFLQACRVSSLEKQSAVTKYCMKVIKDFEQEELATMLRSANFMAKKVMEEAMDPMKFRVAYKGSKALITVRNGLNLGSGSFWDKLDPYAKVKFKGSKSSFKTSVLQDAGSDPVWDCEGSITYGGETVLEIEVYDYDKNANDEVIAVGSLQVEQFCSGFEGMVPLAVPGHRKKKSLKQMMIVIGVQWGLPRDPNALKEGNTLSGTSTITNRLMASTM